MPPADRTLTPVTEHDFGMLRELAGTIWREHYAEIISAAQIDSMLAGRYSDEALREYLAASHRWLDLLRLSGTPAGYCGHELADMPGDTRPGAMKLGQLYVLGCHRGMGLGRFMLDHVERGARDAGSRLIWLQVNKKNTGSIGFYEAMGFEVAREVVIDIGSGFVMDDFVMRKPL